MKGRGMLALAVLSLALACDGSKLPTGPTVPVDPSKIIRDGAHGGNKEFFFLPPMVPIPRNNPDFELGKFNNALRPSLRVEICELNSQYNAQHVQVLPTDAATCRVTKKTFAPGSVQLVNLPLQQNGWWTLLGLPADGFYYVLWDTRQSNLDINKYYRIKVFVDGKADALGVADVDPIQNLRQWKYSLTGEVIQLVDNVMLPITFRVEQGALCETGTTCTSASYTNTTPLQLTVDPEGTGSVAGVLIPDGALPTPANTPSCTPTNPCPTSVVVNITEVRSGVIGQGIAASTICHPDIPRLQQFKGCYNFSTTPELRRLNEDGDQFIKDVLVAVCYELEGSGDPREKFAQLYQSGPGEPSRFLADVHEGTLIGAVTQDCTAPVIGARSSNPLIQFASTGWRAIKGGLDRVFGIKTAYAVDLGLGGLTKRFSHISPVLRVGIQSASPQEVTLASGQDSTNASVKIVAEHFHTPVAPGVNNVPVTFTVAEGNGTIKLVGDAGAGVTTPITVNTDFLPAAVPIPGIASVSWMPPAAAGTYTLTATGPTTGQVVFTAIVSPSVIANAVLSFNGTRSQPIPAGGTYVFWDLAVTNYQIYPAEMFVAAPNFPTPCPGIFWRTLVEFYDAGNDSRPFSTACNVSRPIDLTHIDIGGANAFTRPANVYLKLVDRVAGVTYRSNTVALSLPDLAISSGPPVVTIAGGFFRFSMGYSNTGGKFTLAGGARAAFYISDDSNIDTNDRFITSSQLAGGSLEAGGSIGPYDHAVSVPPGLAPGVYYFGVIVDDDKRVTESNENNNSVSAPVIIVGPNETALPWGVTERRMLSMQTGAAYRLGLPSLPSLLTWVSSDETKISVTHDDGFDVVYAIVGGESQTGGAEASISSTYPPENSGPSALVNSFSFILFPRVTTLAWTRVVGAVAYHVVTEIGNGSASNPFCRFPTDCGLWTPQPTWTASAPTGSTFTTGLTHTFNFVGGQPGRWRVFAIAANGDVINTSAYVYFAYDPSS